MKIDLRSDTVTQPTEEMRKAMYEAELGDDVYGEDPSVNALQEYAANWFGVESALFCPSGTMANQIAISVHTRPGDEVICDAFSHIYLYEGGGIARNAHCSVNLIHSKSGQFTAEDVLERIQPNDIHKPRTRLVSLENTCNKGGGTVWDLEQIKRIREVCSQNKLALHLDGARLFNALIKTDEFPKQHGELFDSISICLSKGLGAPVGSLLLGSKAFIDESKRVRKVMGGGMRQAGVLAAGGMYALKNNVQRLLEDQTNAQKLADLMLEHPQVEEVFSVHTNIVLFSLKEDVNTNAFLEKWKSKHILASTMGPRLVRLVTHLNISDERMSYFKENYL